MSNEPLNSTEANNVLIALAESFIEWKNKLHKEMRGDKLMFDVPNHYKWLDESELLTYYMDWSLLQLTFGNRCTFNIN